ncbi:unnamed protein product [Penicillium nalgiovense]|nr:unnamed protein product [Penicillium nalgiovense]
MDAILWQTKRFVCCLSMQASIKRPCFASLNTKSFFLIFPASASASTLVEMSYNHNNLSPFCLLRPTSWHWSQPL